MSSYTSHTANGSYNGQQSGKMSTQRHIQVVNKHGASLTALPLISNEPQTGVEL